MRIEFLSLEESMVCLTHHRIETFLEVFDKRDEIGLISIPEMLNSFVVVYRLTHHL